MNQPFDPNQFGATPVETPVTPSATNFNPSSFGATPVQPQQPSMFGHPLDALSQQYTGAIDTAKEATTSGANTMKQGGIGNIAHGALQSALGGASSAVQAVFAPFSASANAIVPGDNNIASDTAKGAVVGAELGTIVPGAGTLLGAGIGALFGGGMHVINSVKDAIFAHTNISPGDKAMVNNALNVGLAVIGEKVGESKGKGLNTDVSQITPDTMKANINPPTPPPPPGGTPEFTPEELQTHLQGVAEDWTKPTLDPSAKYDGARTVLAKDPNIPTNLAQDGVNPFTHIDDKGNFETADAAGRIRTNNGQLAQDNLRPALTTADYTTPKLEVATLSPTPDTTYGITPTMTKAVEAKIETFQSDLAEKYPKGMSLIDQLNEKINYDKNGGYNPTKPESENITAIANRSMANSLSNNIKANVPENLGYDAFQKYLASRYRMADYLDELNGKKVPVSAKLNMIRVGSKFLGAAVMRHIVPGMGDLITSFAGYQGGKMLEHYVEQLTNPMRDEFLQRMAQSNPEAVKGLQKYMSNIEIQRANSLKLPAPKPGATNPIPMGGKSGKSSVESIPATKNPVSVNPKTGKFQTSYSSTPK